MGANRFDQTFTLVEVTDSESVSSAPRKRAGESHPVPGFDTIIDEEPRRRFPDPEARLACGHGNAACQACLLRFTIDSLESHGQWSRISCIECKAPTTRDGMLEVLPANEIGR